MSAVEESEDITDIFGSGLGLFGDTLLSHGTPGSSLEYIFPGAKEDVGVYPRFSRTTAQSRILNVSITTFNSTDLFAHYVWIGALVMSDALAVGLFDVKGKICAEFGAGAGLPSLVAAHCGASGVIITDYPEDKIVQTMHKNVESNYLQDKPVSVNIASHPHGGLAVLGHKWGDSVREICDKAVSLRSSTAIPPALAAPAPNPDGMHQVDVALLADVLWLPHMHQSLLESVRACLRDDGLGQVLVTFADHTDKADFDLFFNLAKSDAFGFEVAHIQTVHLPGAWGHDYSKWVQDETELRKRTVYIYSMRLPAGRGEPLPQKE